MKTPWLLSYALNWGKYPAHPPKPSSFDLVTAVIGRLEFEPNYAGIPNVLWLLVGFELPLALSILWPYEVLSLLL